MTDKDREVAFGLCMGDVNLPPVPEPDYETFIFNYAWQAATERAEERERELKIGITYALHEDLLPSECKVILEQALKGESE